MVCLLNKIMVNTHLRNVRQYKDIVDMYDALQELVCAFVVNQDEVARAKRMKKSMLKVYQNRDADLESAFRDCLSTCDTIIGRYRR